MSDVLKELKDGVEKHQQKLDSEVTKLQTELAEKGATIEQIQKETTEKFSALETELKEAKAAAGRTNQINADMASTIMTPEVHKAALKFGIAEAVKEMSEAKAKTLEQGKETFFAPIDIQKAVGSVLTANLTGGNYRSYLPAQPGYEPMGQTNFRDFFRVINSATDFVSFPRVNTPIGEGSMGVQTEGLAKPQVDRDFTLVNVTLETIAGYLKASRQSLRNIPFLRDYLSQSLPNELYVTENDDWGGDLWNAATTVTPVAGTPFVNILLDLRTRLITNKYSTSVSNLVYFVTPDVWASILLTTSPDGTWFQNPNTLTVTPTGDIRYLGISIVPVTWFGSNTGRVLLVDTSKVAIVQSEGINLRSTEFDQDDFIKNMITFRIEETANLAMFRLDAMFKATYVPPAPEEE